MHFNLVVAPSSQSHRMWVQAAEDLLIQGLRNFIVACIATTCTN